MFDSFKDKKYREAFVEANIRNRIAFQIRALRKKASLSQKALGKRAGKPQNVISRLEDPDYGKFTINTLCDLASAFDVALMVHFVPFSELIETLRHVDDQKLAVLNFNDEMNKFRELSHTTDKNSALQQLETKQRIPSSSAANASSQKPHLGSAVNQTGPAHGTIFNQASTGHLAISD